MSERETKYVVKWQMPDLPGREREEVFETREGVTDFIAVGKSLSYVHNIRLIKRTDVVLEEFGDGEQVHEDWS